MSSFVRLSSPRLISLGSTPKLQVSDTNAGVAEAAHRNDVGNSLAADGLTLNERQ